MTRVVVGLLVMAIAAIAGGAGYLWHQGAQAMGRAEKSGWFSPEPDDQPLTEFEATVAKAVFGESWNRVSFPCRSMAEKGMTVSGMLARDIEMTEFEPQRTLESQFRRIATACMLETGRDDTKLLRIWLRQFQFGGGNVGPDAAAQTLFQKPASQLDENEAAKLAAIIESPGLWKQPERLDTRARFILERAQQYEWDGRTMRRLTTGNAE